MPAERTVPRRCMAALISVVAVVVHLVTLQESPQVPQATGSGVAVGSAANTSVTATAGVTPLSAADMQRLRNHSVEMFQFAFGGYMKHAFPKDDLRPVSCRGHNSQGGIATTLIDALDSLLLLNNSSALRHAVRWVAANASFDVDARVHVFEVTIRALGGLLSTHMLLEQDPHLVPGYGGALLRAAVDLAVRLLPAFDTPTGVPLSWVNLRRGRVRGETRTTCTACAGTLLLEFGVLSRLTGNATYEALARRAVVAVWSKRSVRGMVGNTLNVDSGVWVRRDAGVGAGVDSFYEYLLKSYLAFGDAAYLDMFAEAYAAATAHMALSPALNGAAWLLDVHMASGRVIHPYVSSLGAFWPGLQALVGQTAEGKAGWVGWASAWKRFGWLPEMFQWQLEHAHPTQSGYPLRPELVESTFMLYAATGDPLLLRTGAEVAEKLRRGTRARCGHASVGDVASGRLEDTMESFFLSETTKYLYLLFSNATGVVDHFVLSTEAHLFPPFLANGSASLEQEVQADEERESGYGSEEQAQCAVLCSATEAVQRASTAELRRVLPHLPLRPWAPGVLLHRRCVACKAVTRAVAAAKKRADRRWRAAHDGTRHGAQVAPAQWATAGRLTEPAPWPATRQFVCALAVAAPHKMGCSVVREVPAAALTCQSVQALPANAVFLQLSTVGAAGSGRVGQMSVEAAAAALVAVELRLGVDEVVRLPAMLADFGPDLLPGCNASDPEAVAASRRRWEELVAEQLEAAAADIEEESVEVDESQEEVRARIERLEREEESCGGGQAAGGGSAAAVGTAADGDEDEYVDPDDLPDDSGHSSAHTGVRGAGPTGPVCEAVGRPVAADPPEACAPLANTADMAGAVVVALRGNCSFAAKVLAAQAAGAAAVVVVNNEGSGGGGGDLGWGLMPMGGGGTKVEPAIPAVMVRAQDGPALLRAASPGLPASVVRVAAPPEAVRRALAEELLAAQEQAAAVELAAGGEEATLLPGGSDTCPASPNSDGASSAAAVKHNVELVLPANSQAWVMHQMYQQRMDVTPAFQALLQLLRREEAAQQAGQQAKGGQQAGVAKH